LVSLQIKDQDLMRALRSNEEAATLVIDAQMIELSLYRGWHDQLSDGSKRCL
jgi:hypothetical protein